jgi:hypothetical protein
MPSLIGQGIDSEEYGLPGALRGCFTVLNHHLLDDTSAMFDLGVDANGVGASVTLNGSRAVQMCHSLDEDHLVLGCRIWNRRRLMSVMSSGARTVDHRALQIYRPIDDGRKVIGRWSWNRGPPVSRTPE